MENVTTSESLGNFPKPQILNYFLSESQRIEQTPLLTARIWPTDLMKIQGLAHPDRISLAQLKCAPSLRTAQLEEVTEEMRGDF